MIYRIGIILGALVSIYLLAIGVLYVSGFRVYRIPTAAMEPTIQKGERVVGRLSESYRNRLTRFDVAIYRTPQFPGQIYTKRIVGLSGERIDIDQSGVFIDGRRLTLPLAMRTDGLGLKKCSVVVPADSVFVLGDSTANSADSRYLGPVGKKDVIGYLVFKK